MKQNDILLPFRRLHGYIHDRWVTCKNEMKLYRYLRFPLGQKVFIPGTPEHQNLGDSAIVVAQVAFLKKCGFSTNHIKEITFSEYAHYRKVIKHCINKRDFIAQLGGGNMGDQWLEEEKFHRDVLTDFPENNVVIFPQTIFYTDTELGHYERQKSVSYYKGKKGLTLVAREKKSYTIMKSLYPETTVLLVPDIVLSVDKDNFDVEERKRKGILLCMRQDVERRISQEKYHEIISYLDKFDYNYRVTDMYSDCYITKEKRFECVRQKLSEFIDAELVITDRLHGMVFSAITGTPCIVFENYNHKVRGTYEWIKYLSYIRLAESVSDMERYLPELLTMGSCRYDNTMLLSHFEELAEVIRSYVSH